MEIDLEFKFGNGQRKWETGIWVSLVILRAKHPMRDAMRSEALANFGVIGRFDLKWVDKGNEIEIRWISANGDSRRMG